jgi:hypothetical protein
MNELFRAEIGSAGALMPDLRWVRKNREKYPRSLAAIVFVLSVVRSDRALLRHYECL